MLKKAQEEKENIKGALTPQSTASETGANWKEIEAAHRKEQIIVSTESKVKETELCAEIWIRDKKIEELQKRLQEVEKKTEALLARVPAQVKPEQKDTVNVQENPNREQLKKEHKRKREVARRERRKAERLQKREEKKRKAEKEQERIRLDFYRIRNLPISEFRMTKPQLHKRIVKALEVQYTEICLVMILSKTEIQFAVHRKHQARVKELVKRWLGTKENSTGMEVEGPVDPLSHETLDRDTLYEMILERAQILSEMCKREPNRYYVGRFLSREILKCKTAEIFAQRIPSQGNREPERDEERL